jgi:beta-N-acetylhexosaminidase
MGFEGIVITDCLEMAAIEKNRPAPQAALEAIAAGATMALICHTKQKQIAAIESLTHAVENGKLSREAIDAASEIISNIKGRVSFAGSSLEGKIVPSKSLSETVATEAVSIIRNEDSTIPLRLEVSEKLAVIVPAFEALTKVEEDAEPHRVLLEEIGQRHRELLYRKVAVEPSADEISECMEICRGADMLLILTYNLHRYPSQGKLVGALLGVGKRSVVAAVRDPYDLAFVPKANACVATYSFRECSLKALARILFGEAEARGKSPIKFN